MNDVSRMHSDMEGQYGLPRMQLGTAYPVKHGRISGQSAPGAVAPTPGHGLNQNFNSCETGP